MVFDFPTAPVLSHIDQDVAALRLAIQAGPASPEGRVVTIANAIAKNGRYMIDALWLYYYVRDIPVGLASDA
jgi:hypothetical protein